MLSPIGVVDLRVPTYFGMNPLRLPPWVVICGKVRTEQQCWTVINWHHVTVCMGTRECTFLLEESHESTRAQVVSSIGRH